MQTSFLVDMRGCSWTRGATTLAHHPLTRTVALAPCCCSPPCTYDVSWHANHEISCSQRPWPLTYDTQKGTTRKLTGASTFWPSSGDTTATQRTFHNVQLGTPPFKPDPGPAGRLRVRVSVQQGGGSVGGGRRGIKTAGYDGLVMRLCEPNA